MEPETVFLNLSPDHPMFISINSLYRIKSGSLDTFGLDYQRVWRKFIQLPRINAKFFVNSAPRFISEAMLSGDKLNKFMS